MLLTPYLYLAGIDVVHLKPRGSIRRHFKSDDADDNERDGKKPERRRRLSEKDDTRNHTADSTAPLSI